MVGAQVVPWADWEEWLEVKADLFSSEEDCVLSAIKKVQFWRQRGALPLSVEISEILVEALALQRSNIISDSVFQYIVSMGLVRLVNGMVDSIPHQMTVDAGAASIGMPRVFVDIRHEATHQALPSSSMLQLAAGRALEWLMETYWQPQHDRLLSAIQKCRELFESLANNEGGSTAKVESELLSLLKAQPSTVAGEAVRWLGTLTWQESDWTLLYGVFRWMVSSKFGGGEFLQSFLEVVVSTILKIDLSAVKLCPAHSHLTGDTRDALIPAGSPQPAVAVICCCQGQVLSQHLVLLNHAVRVQQDTVGDVPLETAELEYHGPVAGTPGDADAEWVASIAERLTLEPLPCMAAAAKAVLGLSARESEQRWAGAIAGQLAGARGFQ